MRRCAVCKTSIEKRHTNAKYCKNCAATLLRKPPGRLTQRQENKIKKMAGTYKRHEIASEVGVSMATLQRYARDKNFTFFIPRYSQKIIDEVLAHYVLHGKAKTQKKFKKVSIRSIVERYTHEARQKRWTGKQLIELARMAGLVSRQAQAHYFNRPHAASGSIKSAWVKRYRIAPRDVNGIKYDLARKIIMPGAQFTFVKGGTRMNALCDRAICLWIDVEKQLKPELPKWIKRAVAAMAKFQRWLHKTKKHDKIIRMIREREL